MRTYSWSTCCALTSIAIALVGCEFPQSTSPVAADSGFTGHVEALSALDLGEPFPRLRPDELARFEAGKDEFDEVETVEEGLGPVFNEAACSTCHTNPIGGSNGRLETRFGKLGADGVFDPMATLGGSLLQDHGIPGYNAEVVPTDATVTAGRITTQLFGLGLVDAVPDEELLHLARIQAVNTPQTAGTANIVLELRSGLMRVGRFGWKAQVPTLFQFSGDAYLNEMGITNPEFPAENCPQGDCASLVYNPVPGLNNDGDGVAAFNDFMTLLAPPSRGAISAQVVTGSLVFDRIGCGSCHTPVLATGPNPVKAVSQKLFHPYSDFLLHDMGGLGDGIVQGGATGSQMRTAPLWGVRTRAVLLHDGRATTIQDAIAAHDGQGRLARDRFLGLSATARTALIAFVRSL